MQRTLPSRPRLEFIKREAKEWLRAVRKEDPEAFERLGVSASDPASIKLSTVQFALAKEYGFASWGRLKRHVEFLALAESDRLDQFTRAAVVDPLDPESSNLESARFLLLSDPRLPDGRLDAALVCGRLDAFRSALETDPEVVNRPLGRKRWAPLLYVCFSRFLKSEDEIRPRLIEAARLLLDLGADPNAYYSVNDDPNARQTCLYGAAGIARDPELTRLLLDAGADPNDGAPGLGPESLYHAAEGDETHCLRLILERGPDPDKVSYCLGRKLDFEDPVGTRLFLEFGADPNFRHPGPEGATRLMGAVRNGRSREVIQSLLEFGADWRLGIPNGLNPYRVAVRLGRADLEALLEARGASPSAATDIDRLVGLCFQSRLDAARALSRAKFPEGLALSPVDAGMVAEAAWARRFDAVVALVELGFPVDAMGREQMTALHWAAWFGVDSAVDRLLALGADPEVVNGYDGTALAAAVWAVAKGGLQGEHTGVVRRLVERGVEIRGRCLYPSGVAEIDAILAPFMEDPKPTPAQRQTLAIRAVWDSIRAELGDAPTLESCVQRWALVLDEAMGAQERWIEILLKNHTSDRGHALKAIADPDRRWRGCLDLAWRYFGFSHGAPSSIERDRRLDPKFEQALDLIGAGDVDGLRRLLLDRPDLVDARSPWGHRATLLTYVSANGVELHRQQSPTCAPEIARVLLEAGAEVDCVSETYGGGVEQTPLCLLITSQHPFDSGVGLPLLRTLIDHDASVNGVEGEGSPLRLAIQYGRGDVARALSAAGARPKDLATAAGIGFQEDVERWLNPKPPRESLNDALVQAARHGRLQVARRLLDEGADPNASGFLGASALCWAAHGGHSLVVELLLDRGADIDRVDATFKAPPAGWAHENGHTALTRWLIGRGARCDIRQAAAWGLKERMRHMLKENPDPDAVRVPRTALIEATLRQDYEAVEILLGAGASLEPVDEDGRDARDIARDFQDGQLMALFGQWNP